MPDLVDEGKAGHIAHYDELCASCHNADVTTCPLLSVLYEQHIQTYSGMHVFRCDLYAPDEDSEYYLPTQERDPELALGLRTKELMAYIDTLTGKPNG